MKKNKLLTFLSVGVAVVLIGGALIYSLGKNQNSNPTVNTLSSEEEGADLSSAPVLGEANAPVTLVEFGDFQCPACNLFFQKVEPLLRENYIKTGKVKMVFKTLTFIDSFDGYRSPQESFLAGVAGECAKEQGKFWPMHDVIFEEERRELEAGRNPENSGNLNESFFMKTASDLGLDTQVFASCFKEEAKHKKVFDKNMREAEKLMAGRVSTPTVFINGKMIQGVNDFSVYQKAIEEALANQ